MDVRTGDFMMEVNGQTLAQGNYKSLGFGIDYMDHGTCLLITVLSAGPVDDWNKANKDVAVREQDRIVGVNGIHGSARQLLNALKGSGKFELTICRPAAEAKV